MGELEEAAREVHENLGYGFTEAVYHSALERELSERGIGFSSEGSIPVLYKGSPIGRRRPDMFVELEDTTAVVELKAGSKKGEDQLVQYMRLMEEDGNFDVDEGYLIKFNEELKVLKDDDITS